MSISKSTNVMKIFICHKKSDTKNEEKKHY